jgi:DNA-binding response OmpR family regulator
MLTRPLILVADDEQTWLDWLEQVLRVNGFDVAIAMDGAEALAKIQRPGPDPIPDLLVLDIIMPTLMGTDVVRQLRAAGNWVPIILLTSYATESRSERARFIDEGADDYVDKPPNETELVARIRAALMSRRVGVKPLANQSRLVASDGSSRLVFERTLNRGAYLNGARLSLTHKALELLEYLMLHSVQELPNRRLLEDVWAYKARRALSSGDLGTVQTRISELRGYLGDDPRAPRWIANHRDQDGGGYRFLPIVAGEDDRN